MFTRFEHAWGTHQASIASHLLKLTVLHQCVLYSNPVSALNVVFPNFLLPFFFSVYRMTSYHVHSDVEICALSIMVQQQCAALIARFDGDDQLRDGRPVT